MTIRNGDRTERDAGLVDGDRPGVVAKLNHRDLLRESPQPQKRRWKAGFDNIGPCQGTDTHTTDKPSAATLQGIVGNHAYNVTYSP